MFVQANNVGIGGTSAASRNVISGNETFGVLIYHLVTGNTIQGNYIGTSADGTADLGNGSEGVLVQDSSFTGIGGDAAEERNVISGNGASGVALIGGDHNTVQGNRIGTKADGTGDLGNSGIGIDILGSNQNVIGGTGAQGNSIAHNDQNGIAIEGTSANNEVKGNGISSNAGSGVNVSGGPNAIDNNSIVSNGGHGVDIRLGSGVRISANQIIANALLGINLAGGTEDGAKVTANDTDDPDTGPNGLQNYPVLSPAVRDTSTGITTVNGSLNSTPSSQFTIEIFTVVADGSAHGESLAMVGSTTVTTDSGGDKAFSLQIAGVSPGQQLSATATSSTAGTSEFSANVSLVIVP
jgi:hypothetical protein